jgi:hypothetical protein
MTTSSVPQVYSTILNDTITISNTTGSSYYYNTGVGVGGNSISDVTISNGGAVSGSIGIGTGNVTIGSISGAGSGYTWQMPEEFVDAWPEYNRIEKMCEQYPGLKIAFEKFKTTYYLVKDHYDTPEDQRPLP